MGSTEVNILNQVKSNLQGISGGAYNYDFSATDRVIVGQDQEPVRVPCLYIHPISISTSQPAGRVNLKSYLREFRVQIDAFVPSTSSAPGTGLYAALNAGSDVMKALELDRSLGSVGVRDIEIEMSAWDGHELDRPGIGICSMQLRIMYSEVGGT